MVVVEEESVEVAWKRNGCLHDSLEEEGEAEIHLPAVEGEAAMLAVAASLILMGRGHYPSLEVLEGRICCCCFCCHSRSITSNR